MRATAVPVLVQQLLVLEAEQARNQQKEPQEHGSPEEVLCACEKLRVHLSARIGRDGFRTLLVRALRLAAVQFPHLSTVRVTPDGTLEGLVSAPSGSEPQREGGEVRNENTEGAAAILTHLLELLVTFIGDSLTRRMLSTLWPQIDLPELWGRARVDTNTSTGTNTGTNTGIGTDMKGPADGREEELR